MDFKIRLIQINEIIHKSIDKYKQKIINECGYSDMSLSQLYYMEAIFHLENPTLSELANHLNISRASATNGVQKLIHKDLAIKTRSNADQRVFYVHLTTRGQQLIEAEVQAISDFAETIERILNDNEKEQLMVLFDKILEGRQE